VRKGRVMGVMTIMFYSCTGVLETLARFPGCRKKEVRNLGSQDSKDGDNAKLNIKDHILA
jgi:hypothetical protein